ncbi:GDYXXLXY domain-containing protein [Tahibacter amnicola]|uniref:GDYXXLXY domain-containing protein n=1 Tax=Tahibacter amnicola TaxID=2976241 RepID=A0ABY6BNG4_9GAMM|nr:GDYXXLXY domain-containing protein [Tahibacter amnicola]UXI70106.1 GDYXXLXY domain-containing protein [Tahibacter amnicola]
MSEWQPRLAWIGLALVLLLCNAFIASRDAVLRSGTVVFLPLEPADPRSLIQGDYMTLRFALVNDALRARPDRPPSPAAEGFAIVTLDARRVAQFRRLQPAAEPLAEGEYALRFQVPVSRAPYVVTDAFYFAEGSAERYATARFGEVRVTGAGDAVLAGLRDKDFNPL